MRYKKKKKERRDSSTFLEKKRFLNDMRDHVDSALTSCCSRVSRVGLVLINQFFKRNNVGRVLFPLFFLFYYYFFFLSLDVIVRRTWFSTRFHFGVYFSLSLFCCWFLLEMWRRKKKEVRFKYSNRWSIVLWLGSVFNNNDFRELRVDEIEGRGFIWILAVGRRMKFCGKINKCLA